jgi:hypothetical protein
MEITDLKPCPFCGSVGVEYIGGTEGVCCHECHAQVFGAGVIGDVETWNRRVPPAALSSLPYPQEDTSGGSGAEPDVNRAADALLNTLWQLVFSGSRSYEENWREMDRRFPQARWLHDALKAPARTADAVPVVVKIKPLEWVPSAEVSGHYSAEFLLDCYYQAWPSNGVAYYDSPFLAAGEKYKNIEEAKLAAQTDYERRIRSALVDAPADITALRKERDEARAKALEEAKAAWHFSACDGEILFEIYRKVTLSITADGVGYAINRGGKWESGKFDAQGQVTEAGEEIAAAIRALAEKEGET